jgi:hypothetical protein
MVFQRVSSKSIYSYYSLPINGSKERREESRTAWCSAVPLYYYWVGLDCCEFCPISVIYCPVT